MLPGVDMLRLFIERILRKENPFYGDRNHLHHLLHEKLGKKLTTLVYFLLFLTPILLYKTKIVASYYIITATIIIYIFTIKIIKK
jgi:UDP-GlcNAc:undecaprenyl-phosphate GlcNAc-1-phosphate transferase